MSFEVEFRRFYLYFGYFYRFRDDLTGWGGCRFDLTASGSFRKGSETTRRLGEALERFRNDLTAWGSFRKVQIRLDGLGKL